MSELTPSTKALLRAARSDGPSAAARAQIWSGVSSGVSGTAVGAAGKAIAGGVTAKLFAMGALLGSAVTVGVAAVALHIGAPTLRGEAAEGPHADLDMPLVQPAPHAERDGRDVAPPSMTSGPLARHAAHAPPAPAEDPLAREAALVTEARAAVVHGNPEGALGSLRLARALPARALEPEELSLEARALRALGRSDEASATEARLRARFPGNALVK